MFRHLGMDKFYNINSDDKRYDVTIGNFLRCSCVHFVTMLVGFLGNRGRMCNVNVCIMSYIQLCSMGSWKSSFIIAHGIGMKFKNSQCSSSLCSNDNTSQLHMHKINCDFSFMKFIVASWTM
jgi:hypothetical protein